MHLARATEPTFHCPCLQAHHSTTSTSQECVDNASSTHTVVVNLLLRDNIMSAGVLPLCLASWLGRGLVIKGYSGTGYWNVHSCSLITDHRVSIKTLAVPDGQHAVVTLIENGPGEPCFLQIYLCK